MGSEPGIARHGRGQLPLPPRRSAVDQDRSCGARREGQRERRDKLHGKRLSAAEAGVLHFTQVAISRAKFPVSIPFSLTRSDIPPAPFECRAGIMCNGLIQVTLAS